MPGCCASPHAGLFVRRFDHHRGAIADDRNRYTTKCFTGFDKIRLTLDFLRLLALVGVWAIACRLAWQG